MHLEISALLAYSSFPTEAERAHLIHLLNTSNNEISRLTASIDELIMQRELLQHNVASYKAILAPIRRLPSEVLQEIFVSCLPPGKAVAPSTTVAPLLLGRISRSWRELALSTPPLWASIHVVFPTDDESESFSVQQLYHEVEGWITRSGTTCPLTIEVGATGGFMRGNYPTNSPAMQFIELLAGLSHRWSSFKIEGPAQWLNSLSSLSKNDVPMLEEFSYREKSMSPDSQLSVGILGGQHLRDLGLYNLGLEDTLAITSNINFGQLTRLNLMIGLHGFSLLYIADILASCPNLIACRMLVSSDQPTTPWNLEALTLHHLSTLTLILRNSNEPSNIQVDEFFSRIRLPQLSSLKHRLGTTSWLSLAMGSPIQNLSISLIHLRQEAVLEYLQQPTTSIKRLQIEGNPTFVVVETDSEMDDVVRLMATDDSGHVVCPFLEVLELYNFHSLGTDNNFITLIKQRTTFRSSDGETHLKVVHTTFRPNYTRIDLGALSQLDDLIASGLSLSVVSQPTSNFRHIRLGSMADHYEYWPPATAAESRKFSGHRKQLEWPN
ncbi:hypothetical protein C8J56DRAFT_478812 [Mycena floridula]|nr:hypothetical protein C8J56DRAFT_478812 [Mycena floridula]